MEDKPRSLSAIHSYCSYAMRRYAEAVEDEPDNAHQELGDLAKLAYVLNSHAHNEYIRDPSLHCYTQQLLVYMAERIRHGT